MAHQAVARLSVKDYKADLKPVWCPGCGDFGVVAAVYQALAKLNLDPDNTVLVSGIGCSSRLPGYVNTYSFNTIHGRALPSLGEKRSAWQPGQRQRSVDGCSERDLVTRCTHPSSSLQQHHPPRRDAVRRREPARRQPRHRPEKNIHRSNDQPAARNDFSKCRARSPPVLTASSFFDQHAEQSPEVILAWITADATNFPAPIDHHKQWCEPLHFNKGQIRRQSMVDIYSP